MSEREKREEHYRYAIPAMVDSIVLAVEAWTSAPDVPADALLFFQHIGAACSGYRASIANADADDSEKRSWAFRNRLNLERWFAEQDALDAPVERYMIIESSMENTWTHAILDSYDRNSRAVAWCETHEAAERVRAALNAAERAK